MYMAIGWGGVSDCGRYDTGGDGTAGDLTSFLSALEAADVQLMNLLILPISTHTDTPYSRVCLQARTHIHMYTHIGLSDEVADLARNTRISRRRCFDLVHYLGCLPWLEWLARIAPAPRRPTPNRRGRICGRGQ